MDAPSGLFPVLQRFARLGLNMGGFTSRMVDTSHGRLHVFDAVGRGKLPTTIVLHGLGSSTTQFGRLLWNLKPYVRRLLAPDLPGHGFSDNPREPLSAELLFTTLRDALDELLAKGPIDAIVSSDGPVVLVGNSLGGALALRYALDHPDRVLALVLASPAGAHMDTIEWQTLLDGFRVKSTRDARLLLERLYHRTPIYMPAFASSLRDSLQRKAVLDMLQSVRPSDLPTPERLRELAVPTLLLWGKSERVLPASSLAYFRAHLPSHSLIEEPEGFGHCPHIDDPVRLALRIVEFVASVRR